MSLSAAPARGRRLRLPVLAALLVVAALAALAAPPRAAAHAFLLDAAPAQGSLLPTPPREVVLTFSERFTVVEAHVQVGDQRVDQGAPTIRNDGRSLVIPIAAGSPDGAWVTTFRIVSQDSHVVDGSLIFSVGAAPATPPATLPTLGSSDRAPGAAAAAARWLHLGGLLVLLGALVFTLAAWGPLAADPTRVPAAAAAAYDRVAERVGTAAYGALALGAIATLPIHKWQTGLPWNALLETQFSRASLARIAFLPIAALAMPALARRRRTPLPYLALAGLLICAILPGLSGHASTADGVVLRLAASWLHVVGASLWTGAVVMLATGVVAASRVAPEAGIGRAAVARLGPIAIAGVGTLAVSGLYAAWRETPSLDALRESDWGRALGLKTLLVLIAGGLGLLVRRGAAAVRPGARAESIVLCLAVLATAVMIGLAPPRETRAATGASPNGPAAAPVATGTANVVAGAQEVFVSLAPTTPGARARIHLIAVVANTGQPARLVTDAEATLLGPGGIEQPIELEEIGAAHWTGEVTLAGPGSYTIAFGLFRGDFDVDRAEASFPVG